MIVLAKDAPSAQDEAKKVRGAMICNIIGTVGGILVMIIYIAVVVYFGLLEASMY